MEIINVTEQTINVNPNEEIIEVSITDEIIEVNVTEAVVNVVTQTGAYPLPSNVFSVFGRVGNVVGQLGDYTTSIVAEGTNLYYTQARFNTAFGNKTTTDLTEGTNLYYTDARSRAAISENITGMEYSSASGIFTLTSGYVIPTQASLDAKVPYTGATGDVTLGEHQLTAGQVAFDQTPTGSAGVGVMRWNNTDGTLDLGLKGGNVTLQIGQEQVKRVVNKSGINLTEAGYQVVKIQGAQGQRLAVGLAQADSDLDSATTLGIVTENINNNQEGFITTSGEVRGINTTGSLQGETWADGDVLYLSPTTAGNITNIKPIAPQHLVVVGYVEHAHQNNGKIFVKVDNGYELDELHNVKITNPANNQALVFDSSDSVWKNESIDSALGYTPAPTTRTISTTAPLTGGGDLSADRTLSMPAATTSASGYLTSTDWNTFNGKQPLIAAGTTAQYYRGDKTFQTLDTSAVAEGTNLYYTQARFNTAFGGKTTTDLTEGTNLYYTDARAQASISGTLPISVSGGVVSITQANGAANGYLSSTDWNTFNNKQAALNGTGFVKASGSSISYDNSTYLTTIEGITAGGELSGTYANPSLVNSAVTGKILSGVNITGGTISDTDSILTAFGKLQNQVNGLIGGSIYKGTWNATTNTPTIASGVGTKGNYYIVSVSGTTTIDGISDWNVGDWIIYDGTAWQQVDNTDAVVSVNGETGAVSLTTDNITEGATNLYFTNGRAIASTLTGYTSGSGTISSSDTILTAIQKLNGNVSGLVTGVSSVFGRTGAVVATSGDYDTDKVTEGATNLYYTAARFNTAFSGKSTTDLTEGTNLYYTAARFNTAFGTKTTSDLTEGTNLYYTAARFNSAFSGKTTTDLTEGTNLYYTEARVSANTDVAANTAARHSAVTLGTANGLSLSTQVLSLAAASTSTTGALTSTDWNTFNGKQAALNGTGFVKISGTTISYDNSTYLTTSAASSTYLPLSGGTLTGALSGTSATFSGVTANGTIAINSSNALYLNNSDNTTTAAILNGGSSGVNQMQFYVGGSERLRVTSGGNVGIGTSSPYTKLELYGSAQNYSNSASIVFSDSFGDANSRRWLVGNVAAGNYGDLTFAVSSTPTGTPTNTKMTIQGSGNVGIGTSSPNRLLSLGSSFGASAGLSSNIKLAVFDNGTSGDTYGLGISSAMLEIQSAENIGFYNGLGTTRTERMRITSGGNLLVGTTSDYGSRIVSYGVDATGSNYCYRAINANGIGIWYVRNDGLFQAKGVYDFTTGGGANVSVDADGLVRRSTSSLKYKKNVENYTKGLAEVMQMRPVTYNSNNEDETQTYAGLIAEEIHDLGLAEFVQYAEDGSPDALSYGNMVSLLVKAIQEQQAQIEELKAKIVSL